LSEQLSHIFKVSQLKVLCHERDIDTEGMLEKADLVKALVSYEDNLPPINPHQLQPPLHRAVVRGDIICLRVAETKEELDHDDDDDDDERKDETSDEKPKPKSSSSSSEPTSKETNDAQEKEDKQASSKDEDDDDDAQQQGDQEIEVLSNEEFFLDYTKEEYVKFASRTDIPEYELEEVEVDDDDDDDEGEDTAAALMMGEDGDEIEEEDKNAVFNLVMNEVLRQYREENGRGPNTKELLELRANIAKELDVEVAEVVDGDWDKKAKTNSTPTGKKIAFDPEDEVKEFVRDANEYNYFSEPDAMATMMQGLNDDDKEEEDDDDDDDEDYAEHPAKKRKTTGEDDEEDSKPAAVEKDPSESGESSQEVH
jgi:hypothetical protein